MHMAYRKHLKQKTNYDVKQNLIIYQPGYPVWVLNESRKEHIRPKLQAAFAGPYVVAENLNKLDYRVYKDRDGRRSIRTNLNHIGVNTHINALKIG